MAMSKWIPESDPMILRRVGKTSEEASELVKVCARITIQGMDGVDPASGVANRQALEKEISDVIAQCEVCIDTLGLDRGAIRSRGLDKIDQMMEWEAMFASDRCQHGVRYPHECPECAAQVNDADVADWKQERGLSAVLKSGPGAGTIDGIKYRRKTAVVRAFQMNQDRRCDTSGWPIWLQHAWGKQHDEPGALYPKEFPDSDGTDELFLQTVNGRWPVKFGDWIIRGPAGNLSACSQNDFAAYFEAVA